MPKKLKVLNSSRERKSKRKVNRPPYARLKKEVTEIGYCATGRKYGVSDNAVRKWITNYEKQKPNS
jgi:transposase-like protein